MTTTGSGASLLSIFRFLRDLVTVGIQMEILRRSGGRILVLSPRFVPVNSVLTSLPEVPAFKAKDSPTTIEELKENNGDTLSWPELNANLTVNSLINTQYSSALPSNLHEQSPFSWEVNTSESGINAPPAQFQPSDIKHHRLIQSWKSSSQYGLPYLQAGEVTPGLTTSFQTESDTSASDSADSSIYVNNICDNFAAMDKPANVDGLSAAKDNFNYNFSGSNNHDFSTETDPAFHMGAVFDPGAFQEGLGELDEHAARNACGKSKYEEDGRLNEYPASTSHYHEHLYDYRSSAFDESLSGLY